MGGPSRSESQSAMKDNAVVSDVLTIPTVQPQKCGLANDGRISSGADKGPKGGAPPKIHHSKKVIMRKNLSAIGIKKKELSQSDMQVDQSDKPNGLLDDHKQEVEDIGTHTTFH
ncbi:hypothetical protein LOK49_LG06G01772 [Camellia lanceoleosa]|uniref:Uncharacterized protein n=1 Tax=Camellia lanceoleosa TaxID=1840588 RepID=A0ACC0HDG2_9ERIC|nr:hypothetical protein LOK49_LG06G01772 [Camellia lanceoleosa]